MKDKNDTFNRSETGLSPPTILTNFEHSTSYPYPGYSLLNLHSGKIFSLLTINAAFFRCNSDKSQSPACLPTIQNEIYESESFPHRGV